jgi:DNA-binding GntR family transcriptional regulator
MLVQNVYESTGPFPTFMQVLRLIAMTIDRYDPVPVYQQLARVIATEIRAGQYPPRTPLPSESTLMQRFGVSRGSVRKAMEYLRDQGLVFTVPQRGTYATEGAQPH